VRKFPKGDYKKEQINGGDLGRTGLIYTCQGKGKGGKKMRGVVLGGERTGKTIVRLHERKMRFGGRIGGYEKQSINKCQGEKNGWRVS